MDPFEGSYEEEEDEGIHEVGLYQSYTILASSLKSITDRNVLFYNDIMEELNYVDKDGGCFTVKLFTYTKERLL